MFVHEPTIRTLREVLAAYERIYMPSRNFAPKTRRSYADDLRELIGFLEQAECKKTTDVSLSALEGYLAYLDRRGLAGATCRRKTYAIKSLFAFLYRSDYLPQNPAAQRAEGAARAQQGRVSRATAGTGDCAHAATPGGGQAGVAGACAAGLARE
jgi:site-specific recombinase XerD